MKLTDKRFWNGEKTVYYPSFKYALKDSLLFSISWVGIICLLLCAICSIVYFGNGDNLSGDTISVALIFLIAVFFISNGMFLCGNWFKQNRIINRIKKILPEGSNMQSVHYDCTNKEYKIMLDYLCKTYKVTVEYPAFYISERKVRALGPLSIDSDKELKNNQSLIMNYMRPLYHCPICGLPLDFAPWGDDGKTPTYEICPCCGVEWGNEDYTPESRKECLNKWLVAGAK